MGKKAKNPNGVQHVSPGRIPGMLYGQKSKEPQRGSTCKPGENPRDVIWAKKQRTPTGFNM